MTTRDAVCTLLLVGLAGCSFDFTDLPRDVPAHFHVEVIADSRTDRLTMSARLDPGSTIDGTRRTVLQDMRDGDVTIEPSHFAVDGTRIYEAEWSLSGAVRPDGVVFMRAPEIEGLGSIQQHPVLRVALRDGPDSVFVTGDQPAVLRLESGAPAEDASVNWHLLLTDSLRGGHRSIQGAGSPPLEITIPRSWFDPRSPVYDARLDVYHAATGEFILDRYRWSTAARSHIYWTIIFSDP